MFFVVVESVAQHFSVDKQQAKWVLSWPRGKSIASVRKFVQFFIEKFLLRLKYSTKLNINLRWKARVCISSYLCDLRDKYATEHFKITANSAVITWNYSMLIFGNARTFYFILFIYHARVNMNISDHETWGFFLSKNHLHDRINIQILDDWNERKKKHLQLWNDLREV